MTEKKINDRLMISLSRYKRIISQLQIDLDKKDFMSMHEHMKYGKSVSAMITSCINARRALQPSQKNKKEESDNEEFDNTVSSIQVRIGQLIDDLKIKMKKNKDARKSLSPAIRIKSPFSGADSAVFIDIKS